MTRDWVIKKLKDLGDIQTGTTPPTKEKSNYGDYIPFIKPANFEEDGTIRYDDLGLSEEGLKKGRLIKEDSILMVCIGATIGKTGITTSDVSCNQQINSFTPKKDLCSKFFYYALSCDSFRDKVLKSASQATLPIINKSKWENLDVAFPQSFEEQKQIVAKLDEAFAAIDVAKANIEKNIGNAGELFQSRLNEIFSRNGEGWMSDELKNLSKIMYGYTAKASGDIEGPKYLRITDIQNSNVDWNEVPSCPPLIDDYDKYKLKSGDIVFARTGATTGKSYLIKESPEAVFASYLIRVQPADDKILPEFLYLFFQSPKYWAIIESGISGSAQGGFNAKKLGNLSIPIPPLSEQKEILEKFDELNKYCKETEENYQQKLTNLEELKKSLLQKAFAGELT